MEVGSSARSCVLCSTHLEEGWAHLLCVPCQHKKPGLFDEAARLREAKERADKAAHALRDAVAERDELRSFAPRADAEPFFGVDRNVPPTRLAGFNPNAKPKPITWWTRLKWSEPVYRVTRAWNVLRGRDYDA